VYRIVTNFRLKCDCTLFSFFGKVSSLFRKRFVEKSTATSNSKNSEIWEVFVAPNKAFCVVFPRFRGRGENCCWQSTYVAILAPNVVSFAPPTWASYAGITNAQRCSLNSYNVKGKIVSIQQVSRAHVFHFFCEWQSLLSPRVREMQIYSALC